MIQVNWGTPDPVSFRLSDYSGLTARLRGAGTINAETDDKERGQYLKSLCVSLLKETLAGYGDKVAKDDLAGLVPELCRTLSDKLTERSGVRCSVRIVSLSFDDETQKLINDMDKMKKMSDPAYAAAELEKAMKQARETAEKNGTPIPDPQSMSMPELPPIPDSSDPIARAKAVADFVNSHTIQSSALHSEEVFDGGYAGRFENPASTGFITPQAMNPGTVSTASARPKFCGSCGNRLPETGNFCPNCGSKI